MTEDSTGAPTPSIVACLAEGLEFPEGPVVLHDGRIAFVEEFLGRVSVIEDGHVRTLATLGGAPNGLAVDREGQIWVAQNGGVVGDWRSPDPRPPSILQVDPATGRADTVATEASGQPLQAPNDLCVGPDGTIWFTDPGLYGPFPRTDRGRICRLDAAGRAEIVHQLEPVYPNGIAIAPSGQLVWTESRTRRIVASDGPEGRVLVELDEPAVPDGCTFLPDGTLAVASLGSGGIHLVRDLFGHPDVELLTFVRGCNATNCLVDGDSLIVTDVATTNQDGRLWRVQLGAQG
jgi:gluconolactonase